jgi:hypothetical protein
VRTLLLARGWIVAVPPSLFIEQANAGAFDFGLHFRIRDNLNPPYAIARVHLQEAKAENVTVTSKLRQLQGAHITTYVSPGPGVVAQAVRSGGRKRK